MNEKVNIEAIVKDQTLTQNQRFTSMAKAAENSIQPLEFSALLKSYMVDNVVYDMGEGNAPYRPRYVVADIDLFMKQGSSFLQLDPPTNLFEAVSNLMILVHNIPSASNMPVYIGHLDRLLEPFIKDEEEAYALIKMFLKHVDRTIPDAFCHCDIGPYDTKAGRIILKLSQEMQRPVPNMSLIYDEDLTSDAFALEAIKTGMICAKPSFANNKIYGKEIGDFAIASCYNVFPVGGGGFTLSRLNLALLAKKAKTENDFFDRVLPEAASSMLELMEKRVRYIVEEAGFFKISYLANEGLIHLDRFVAMFGLVGMAECVNQLLHASTLKERYGHNPKADDLAEKILDYLQSRIDEFKPCYGQFQLHAQVGVDDDINSTPGIRIPVGDETTLASQIKQSGRLQKHFTSGVGDIYPFAENTIENPEFILDIIKGAFKENVRYFSFYSENSDLIRVTGYLVKRSDMERLKNHEIVLDNATILGLGNLATNKGFQRKVRSINNA